MSNSFSRRKGLRGEKDIVHKLGGKRVGLSYLKTPVDVQTNFAVYQVRNRSLGGTSIYDALKAMEHVAPNLAKYVVFKPVRGAWICCELLDQHREYHGEVSAKALGNSKTGSETNNRRASKRPHETK